MLCGDEPTLSFVVDSLLAHHVFHCNNEGFLSNLSCVGRSRPICCMADMRAVPLLLALALLLCAPPTSFAVDPHRFVESIFPVHGWDVYYNWAVPPAAPSNSKWQADVMVEVTQDPGEKTYYYWSHFTL